MDCSIRTMNNERLTAKQNLRAIMDCSIIKVSNEKVIANREQLWTAASERRAMKGLQLTASSYKLQHQNDKQ